MDNMPTDALADDQWQSDLGARGVARESVVIFQSVTSAARPPEYARRPRIRKAMSMAIDRDTITKQIFNGSLAPADGWVSPVVEGYKPDQCGEACVYDPARRRPRYDAAGGYDGQLTITYNGDVRPRSWTDAAATASMRRSRSSRIRPEP